MAIHSDCLYVETVLDGSNVHAHASPLTGAKQWLPETPVSLRSVRAWAVNQETNRSACKKTFNQQTKKQAQKPTNKYRNKQFGQSQPTHSIRRERHTSNRPTLSWRLRQCKKNGACMVHQCCSEMHGSPMLKHNDRVNKQTQRAHQYTHKLKEPNALRRP